MSEYVDQDNEYSSYKQFYETAARQLLKREKGELQDKEIRALNDISENVKEDIKEEVKEDLKEEMFGQQA